MGNLTLKSKFNLLITSLFIALLVILFGVRLMGKVTDFAYYEREHVVSLINIEYELSRQLTDRNKLVEQVKIAYQQAININTSIMGAEKLLFRILGQGPLLDVVVKDKKELEKILKFLDQIKVDYLSSQNKDLFTSLMKGPSQNTKLFGPGLRNSASAIKYTVIILVILTIGGSAILLTNMMRSTVPPVMKMAVVIGKVAKGDLGVKIDIINSGEIGEMQTSTIEMINGLRNMLQEISQVAKDLSCEAINASVITSQALQGVKIQKSETEQLVFSISEMSTAISEVANAASGAALAASEGSESASKGRDVVGDAVTSIDLLAAEVDASVKAISRIELDGQKIGSIVLMIEDITEQTSLLALNAAIEAARAGEQGRGFAVVADEVRNLAQRIQGSTQEIQSMIEALRAGTKEAVDVLNRSRERVNVSVNKANQAGKAIDLVVSSVEIISDLNSQIATAAEEQSLVTVEISKNISAINEVADQTASGGYKVAESNEKLVALADQLRVVVNRFDI